MHVRERANRRRHRSPSMVTAIEAHYYDRSDKPLSTVTNQGNLGCRSPATTAYVKASAEAKE